MSLFCALVGQTLLLGIRAGGGAIVALVFFLAVVTIVPFGIGPDAKLLARIGPAILWIAALLASLLGRLMADHRAAGGAIVAATHQDLPTTPDAVLDLAKTA